MTPSEPPIQAPTPLQVPARAVPVPASVSAEAQAALGAMSMLAGAAESGWPALDDLEGWRALVVRNDQMVESFVGAKAAAIDATVEERDIDGVHVFVVTPADADPAANRVCLDVHGGALISGGGAACRAMSVLAAHRVGVTTWGVDYRMPPDHPYPTPLDDCVTVYRALLRTHRPQDIVVAGGSAGANLAAAMLLRARDEGMAMPSAAVLLTPECDLTESGDSFATNLGVDTVLTQLLRPVNDLYAAGHDLTDPYLSPLFGDFAAGFPPTILQTGTRDLFLSNTVRLHRRLRAAGIEVELHVFEAMPHGGFFGAPEDLEIDAEVRAFVDAHWTAS